MDVWKSTGKHLGPEALFLLLLYLRFIRFHLPSSVFIYSIRAKPCRFSHAWGLWGCLWRVGGLCHIVSKYQINAYLSTYSHQSEVSNIWVFSNRFIFRNHRPSIKCCTLCPFRRCIGRLFVSEILAKKQQTILLR